MASKEYMRMIKRSKKEKTRAKNLKGKIKEIKNKECVTSSIKNEIKKFSFKMDREINEQIVNCEKLITIVSYLDKMVKTIFLPRCNYCYITENIKNDIINSSKFIDKFVFDILKIIDDFKNYNKTLKDSTTNESDIMQFSMDFLKISSPLLSYISELSNVICKINNSLKQGNDAYKEFSKNNNNTKDIYFISEEEFEAFNKIAISIGVDNNLKFSTFEKININD